MSNQDYEKDLGCEDKDNSDTNVVTKGAPREFGQIDEGMQEGTDLHRFVPTPSSRPGYR